MESAREGQIPKKTRCLYCRGEFRRPRPSWIRRGQGKYCSRRCHMKHWWMKAREAFQLQIRGLLRGVRSIQIPSAVAAKWRRQSRAQAHTRQGSLFEGAR